MSAKAEEVARYLDPGCTIILGVGICLTRYTTFRAAHRGAFGVILVPYALACRTCSR